MSILLEAEHLTKIFTQRGKNPFKAVNDVSFTLKKGETLGIVGESGSGKSTIAKLLTRLTDITEGTLKFEGKDITRLKQSQLKEVYGYRWFFRIRWVLLIPEGHWVTGSVRAFATVE